ncbi:MAG TPA: phosphatase PAP2 family protein [Pyrinomonadaceae bacterium]|jgi:membrane-associated phospholipid phosphatase|nr:phosphatase PAP2 family protein [Pyrinomonadaceae bacterium]
MSHGSKRRIENWFFIPPVVCLALLVTVNVSGHDVEIFRWLNEEGRVAGDSFWISITTFGDGLVLFVLTLLFIRRKPALAWSLVVSWCLIALWIKGLKAEIVTFRPPSILSPDQFRLIGAAYRYNSFPSGHATSIAAFVASLCLFFRQKVVRVALIGGALLIAYSRIVIGVHWTTDVLAGLIGGWLSALVGYALSTRLKFGTSQIAQIIFAIITAGAALRMFFVNHTDYPQSHRLLQLIAAASILYAGCDYLAARFKKRSPARDPRAAGLPKIAGEPTGNK